MQAYLSLFHYIHTTQIFQLVHFLFFSFYLSLALFLFSFFPPLSLSVFRSLSLSLFHSCSIIRGLSWPWEKQTLQSPKQCSKQNQQNHTSQLEQSGQLPQLRTHLQNTGIRLRKRETDRGSGKQNKRKDRERGGGTNCAIKTECWCVCMWNGKDCAE